MKENMIMEEEMEGEKEKSMKVKYNLKENI